MKYTIECSAIKEYDAAQGTYVKCKTAVEVDSSQVGTLVPCPVCGNDLEVIHPDLVKPKKPAIVKSSATVAQPAPKNENEVIPSKESERGQEPGRIEDANELKPAKQPAKQPVLKSVNTPVSQENGNGGQPGQLVNGDDPVQEPSRENEPKNTSSQNVPGQAGFGPDGGTVLTPAQFDLAHACHHCGWPLEEKQSVCPSCKTPRKAAFVDKKDRKPLSKKGPFGFHLWLDSMTIRKPDRSGTGFGTIFGYVAAFVFMGAGLSMVVFGGLPGIFFGPFVAFIGFAVFTALRYWNAARKDPRTRIPVLGLHAWSLVLWLVRSFHLPKYSKKRILDKHGDESFGDQELASIRNLNEYRVLDLEGTNVTDEGLLYLYNLTGIDYLILNDTRVTEDGVFELQRSIPRTWIWY